MYERVQVGVCNFAINSTVSKVQLMNCTSQCIFSKSFEEAFFLTFHPYIAEINKTNRERKINCIKIVSD